MELYKKLKTLVTKEIKEENEPKETAILIRVLCIMDFLFMLFEFPFMAGSYGIVVICAYFAGMALYALNFFISYKVKMSMLVYCYYFTVSLLSLVLNMLFGFKAMFHLQFAVIFLLFFYRSAEINLVRLLSVIFSSCIYIYCYYDQFKGATSAYGYSMSIMLPIANIIWMVFKTTIIGVLFRIKFSASEEKILKYSRKLELVATTDPLTKLQNRRGMLNHIERFVASSTNKILSIAIGDIDFFKKINDTYGHEAGDYILETLAKLMNDFMDGKGMVARWGGEEFLFAFEELNGDLAFEHLSRLLTLIEKYEFDFKGTEIKLTMTFGVEEHDTNSDIDKTIQAADEKLYMGKTSGRDRVVY